MRSHSDAVGQAGICANSKDIKDLGKFPPKMYIPKVNKRFQLFVLLMLI